MDEHSPSNTVYHAHLTKKMKVDAVLAIEGKRMNYLVVATKANELPSSSQKTRHFSYEDEWANT